MIAGLKGIISKTNINKAYIDVNGIVYEVYISFKSYDSLQEKIGKSVYLHIYHSITDRSQKLFGFLDEKERELFELLKSLQGIGEMTALRVLSFLSPSELIDSVRRDDRSKLEKIPKVKGKTSEKIMFEVKQNLKKFEVFLSDKDHKLDTDKIDNNQLSILALMQLGFDEKTANREVKKVLDKNPEAETAEIIREVLKYT